MSFSMSMLNGLNADYTLKKQLTKVFQLFRAWMLFRFLILEEVIDFGLELEVAPDKVDLGWKQSLYDTALKSNLFPQ